MENPMWKFRKMTRSEMNQDPIQGEFFAPEEGYPGALVRESIQNSLDARNGTGPVRVRFALGIAAGAENTFAESPYLRNLQPHLAAQRVHERPNGTDELSFLSIEDFGTRGLQGDPQQSVDESSTEDGGSKNDFFYFWRNVGRSVKEATQRGRWGLGKTVFPASSRIRSFFGLTARSGDAAALLMGQSVGKIHTLDQHKFAAYGYFGAFEADDFAMPLEEVSALENFRETFALARRAESGLSVVIPFPQAELTPDSLIRESIRNYYLPILLGDLLVEVVGQDGHSRALTKENLRTQAEAVGWSGTSISLDEMLRVLDFAEKCISVCESDVIRLQPPGDASAPSWSANLFVEQDVAKLRDRFERGDLLAFAVPVTVTKKDGWRGDSRFEAYLQRDPHLAEGEGDFVRQGLTISQVNRPPKPGVRGIVIVRDPPLSALLGDSENPAHTKWQERSEALKNSYKHGPSTVRFVIRSLANLSDTLSQPPAGRDDNLLLDLFYVEVPPEDSEHQTVRPGARPDDDEQPGDPPPPIQRNAQTFQVQRLKGGFRVSRHPKAAAIPESLLVEAAYSVRRGNPFRRYQSYDFELGTQPIRLRTVDAEVHTELNRLDVTPRGPNFMVEVTGFDVHRDLEVRVVAGRVEA
jgi:hypothetical protein